MKTKTKNYRSIPEFCSAMVKAQKAGSKNNPSFRFRGNVGMSGYSIECKNTLLAVEKRARALQNSVTPSFDQKGVPKQGIPIKNAPHRRISPLGTRTFWPIIKELLLQKRFKEASDLFDSHKIIPTFANISASYGPDVFGIMVKTMDLPTQCNHAYMSGTIIADGNISKSHYVIELESGQLLTQGATRHKAIKQFGLLHPKTLFGNLVKDNQDFQTKTLKQWKESLS